MGILEEWLSPKYHLPRKLRAKYVKATPYPHARLKDFLREDKAQALLYAVRSENFYQKESDLFKLSQTNELRNSTNPVIQSFRMLLASDDFSKWLQTLTGVHLTNNDLDMSGSLYQDTCFLLCHDDRVTGRKIAYIYALNDDFAPEDGGALVLFNDRSGKPGREIKRYSPAWNTFSMFTVSKKSWHAVEEVLTRRDRLSINGWFH